MRTMRRWLTESKWYVTYGLVLTALVLAVSVGSCGDDNGSCEYNFTNVLSQDECNDLAAGFDCNSVQYNAGEELCATAGCACAAFNCEYEFTNVESQAECDNLGEQLFCESVDYNPDNDACAAVNCICGDIDEDTDVDSDTDL